MRASAMRNRATAVAAVRGQLAEYYVGGTGEFPLDMLRYDSCWPASEWDSNRALDRDGGLRIVKVKQFTHSGAVIGLTEDRWRSFGWRPLSLAEEVEEVETRRCANGFKGPA